MWSKPNYIELDRKTVMEKINAKAWTVGDAMSCQALCEQGVGAKGVIQLPDGTYEEAVVAFFDLLKKIFKLIANGKIYFYDTTTGILS